MIKNFGNKLAEQLFDDERPKKFPSDLIRVARRKLLYLHEAEDLIDLRVPPGSKLELLKGDLKEYYSIRINDKWRIIFKFEFGNAVDVKILDYHD
jgi:proteic killer suppression protein